MSKNNILKRLSPLHIVALVCAAVILVTIIVSAVLFGINAADKKKDEFNYNDNNLIKEYITLGDYSKLTVTHEDSKVRPEDLEEAVLDLLEGQKNKISGEPATHDPDITITVGDVVNIFYRGYVLIDEDLGDVESNRDYQLGMTNFVGRPYSAMKSSAITIGNSGFIPGFASQLDGAKVSDYTEFNRVRGDEVAISDTDVIFVTYNRNPLSYNKYSGVETIGTAESATSALIDLSLGKDKIDEIYGLGFYDMLFTGRDDKEDTKDVDESINVAKADGKNIINDTKDGFKTTKNDNADVTAYKYTSIKVEGKMSHDDYASIKTITVVFPEDYQTTDLAGKTAVFQVMIESVEEYTFTLGEGENKNEYELSLKNIETDNEMRGRVNTVLKTALKDNKGFQNYLTTLPEDANKEDYYANYKNYLTAQYNVKNDITNTEALYNAIIDALVKKATVLKDHPDLEEKYNASLITFRSEYAKADKSKYATIEEYAEEVIGGDYYLYLYEENGEWKTHDGVPAEDDTREYTKIFDWKTAVKQERVVRYYTELLVIHYIVNEQGLLNSEGAYDKAYNAIFEDYIAAYTTQYCNSKDILVNELSATEKENIEATVRNSIISNLGYEELEKRAYEQLVYDYYLGENAKGELVKE